MGEEAEVEHVSVDVDVDVGLDVGGYVTKEALCLSFDNGYVVVGCRFLMYLLDKPYGPVRD